MKQMHASEYSLWLYFIEKPIVNKSIHVNILLRLFLLPTSLLRLLSIVFILSIILLVLFCRFLLVILRLLVTLFSINLTRNVSSLLIIRHLCPCCLRPRAVILNKHEFY